MSAGISEPESPEYYRPYIDHRITVLGGFDIYKSKSSWIAIVACDTLKGKDIRFYKWTSRYDTWKVDLARMSCGYWDWEEIFEKVNILKEKFEIK